MECGHYYNDSPASAVMAGRVGQHDLDQSLSNLYVVLMRLGFFDGIPALASLGKDDISAYLLNTLSWQGKLRDKESFF